MPSASTRSSGSALSGVGSSPPGSGAAGPAAVVLDEPGAPGAAALSEPSVPGPELEPGAGASGAPRAAQASGTSVSSRAGRTAISGTFAVDRRATQPALGSVGRGAV